MRADNLAPSVAVCIPTYNRAGFLPSAIKSALDQTYEDFEVIVLDDCSTDDTAAVVSSFSDPRLRYHCNAANLGMTGNWNECFQVTHADYVALLHDDDVWAPDFLRDGMRVIRSEPDIGLLYCATLPIDYTGKVIGGRRLGLAAEDWILPPAEALSRLVRRSEVAASAVIVSRDAFVECGGFRQDWPFHMDWQLWLKIAGRHRIAFLAAPLGHIRSHPDQLTAHFQSQPLAIARDAYGMLSETIAGLPLPPAERENLQRQALRSLAQTQLVYAGDTATRGLRMRAWHEANFAFKIDRLVALHAPTLTFATYAGLLLPARFLSVANRYREKLRPFFRRD